MNKFLIVVTLSGLVLGGCANKTESGALVGAGGGALVGGPSVVGNARQSVREQVR